MKKSSIKLTQEGFTLTETLTAILILLFSSSAVLFGIRGVLTIYEKLTEDAKLHAELILFRETLIENLNDIVIPFWETEPDIALSGNDGILSLAYYKGDKEAVLKLGFTQNGFSILTPLGQLINFPHITNGNVIPFIKDNITTGISITLYLKNEELNFILPFGSWPLMKGKDN
ncbi:MAG: hypothetical protein L3J12_09415 [Spirochaetales bacterium]|nr:hypothetical protein [Spirochaetales bacterium]